MLLVRVDEKFLGSIVMLTMNVDLIFINVYQYYLCQLIINTMNLRLVLALALISMLTSGINCISDIRYQYYLWWPMKIYWTLMGDDFISVGEHLYYLWWHLLILFMLIESDYRNHLIIIDESQWCWWELKTNLLAFVDASIICESERKSYYYQWITVLTLILVVGFIGNIRHQYYLWKQPTILLVLASIDEHQCCRW